MDDGARASSVRAFESAIYPFWASIEKQDTERESAMTSAQVGAPGQVLYECLTMHRQDRAIHASGIKPNKNHQEQSRMEEIRRRATKAAS
jgi:hypothetical protein